MYPARPSIPRELSMTYTAEISRSNPTCFIFLVDQSASMLGALDGVLYKSKADAVADAINRLLADLVQKCVKEEGVRDYFHVAVIGYGEAVGSALSGPLADRNLVALSEIADNPKRLMQRIEEIPDEAGVLQETPVIFPVWVDPVSAGPTPMNSALEKAEQLISSWVDQYPGCFPPIVLNLSDGASTDGDPSDRATSLRSQATSDGAALLFNLHVSRSGGKPVMFPDDETELPDDYSRLLYSMSSFLPPHIRSHAESQGHDTSENTRGFVYNADIAAIVEFLEIGTRTTHLL